MTPVEGLVERGMLRGATTVALEVGGAGNAS